MLFPGLSGANDSKRCDSAIFVLLSSVIFSCSSSCLWFGLTSKHVNDYQNEFREAVNTRFPSFPISCLGHGQQIEKVCWRNLLLVNKSNLQVVQLRISKLLP